MNNTVIDLPVQEEDRKLKISAKLSYGLGDFASNLCWTMITTYLLFFYTDISKLNLVAISLLFLIARVFDAFIDPVMGIIADHTHTKWGRFRPYILFGSIYLSLMFFLCFSVPNSSETLKIAYAYVTYILLGIGYTVVNMPYGAMAASITQNADERSSLSAFRVFFAIMGTVFVSFATLPLVKFLGHSSSNSSGFSRVALLYAVIMLPLYFLVFKNSKEVVKPVNKKRIAAKEIMKVIFMNKPLVILLVTTLIASTCMFFRQSMLIYYVNHVLVKPELSSIFLGIMALTMLIGLFLSVPVSKKLGSKRNTYIIGIVGSGATNIAMFFTSVSNVSFILMWTVIGAIFTGSFMVMSWSMIADTIEYAEWKIGVRADGTIYSSASFVQKIATALSGWSAAMLLSATGYVSDKVQNTAVIAGINISTTLVSGLVMIATAVPLLFYSLDRSRYNQIVAEIKNRDKNLGY